MYEIKVITVQELKTKLAKKSIILIDVREEEDFIREHIPGAVHLDEYNFSEFVANTPITQPLAICCYCGNRSKKIVTRLLQKGFTEVYNLTGGITAWKAAGNPV